VELVELGLQTCELLALQEVRFVPFISLQLTQFFQVAMAVGREAARAEGRKLVSREWQTQVVAGVVVLTTHLSLLLALPPWQTVLVAGKVNTPK